MILIFSIQSRIPTKIHIWNFLKKKCEINFALLYSTILNSQFIGKKQNSVFNIYVYIYMYVYVCVYVYIYICMCVCMCMYMCMYVYIYVYICMYMCVYI